MQDQVKLGMNRTGLQMSPADMKDLLETATEEVLGDPLAMANLREEYIADAEPLGSVPPPGTVKGALQSGVKMLTGKHPELFVDKLAERLAYERGGTRLYDGIIAKFNATAQDVPNVSLAELTEIRNEEAAHFHLLAEALTKIGADPTAQTPSADLVGVETAGLMQAVNDPRTTFLDCLQVALTAELTDVDAWGLLAQLADANGEEEMARSFRRALQEENEHLMKVRTWYQDLLLDKIS
ncbi:MAG TPA: ferritin-like domain-containing protein [Archangium sp.]